MELVVFTVNIISASLCVALTAVNAWLVRRGPSGALTNDVGELTEIVEKLAKDTRRQRMREVRAGKKASETSIPEAVETISKPVGAPDVLPETGINDIQALRREFFRNRVGSRT